MVNYDLLEILKKYDSILLNQAAASWKDAIKLAIDPLIEAKLATQNYYQSIIEVVETHGPYFIISENVAMPHAGSDKGALGTGFSLVTLNDEVVFPKDSRKIKLLIGFVADSPDVHVGLALPQIAALLENDENVNKILKANSTAEVIEILQKIDLKKYLNSN